MGFFDFFKDLLGGSGEKNPANEGTGHHGRTTGGYTFIPEEHERGEGGKFAFEGGPKPYVKKSGEVSEKSAERVKQSNEGRLPEPATVPFPTQEQLDKAEQLVKNWEAAKESGEADELATEWNTRLQGLKEELLNATSAIRENQEVSTFKKVTSNVLDFLGFGPDDKVSQSKRNFIKKSMAVVAAQAMPSIPGGKVLEELMGFSGASAEFLTKTPEAVVEKSYSGLAKQIVAAWGKAFATSENIFDMEDYESEAEDVQDAEGLKDLVETIAFHFSESFNHIAGENGLEALEWLDIQYENIDNLKSLLQLAGSNDFGHIPETQHISDMLAAWKREGYPSLDWRGIPKLDKFGNVLNHKGGIEEKYTKLLNKLESVLPPPEVSISGKSFLAQATEEDHLKAFEKTASTSNGKVTAGQLQNIESKRTDLIDKLTSAKPGPERDQILSEFDALDQEVREAGIEWQAHSHEYSLSDTINRRLHPDWYKDEVKSAEESEEEPTEEPTKEPAAESAEELEELEESGVKLPPGLTAAITKQEGPVSDRIEKLRGSEERKRLEPLKEIPPSLENGGTELAEEHYNDFLDGVSQEEFDALKKYVPNAVKAMQEIDLSEGGIFGPKAIGEHVGPAGALTNSPIHQIHSVLNAWRGEGELPRYDYDPNSGELGRLEQWQEKSPEEHLEQQRIAGKDMLEKYIEYGDYRGYGSIAKNVEQTEAINPSQEMAIVRYLGPEYTDIQSGLREGTLSPDLQETVDLISKSIDSYSITNDMTLYRGLANQETDNEYMESLLNAESGSIIENASFVSTSSDRNFANEFAEGASLAVLKSEQEVKGLVLEISLKKGQKALPMGLATKNIDQLQEMLLDKSSRFKVDSVDKENRVVKLTLLNKEEEKPELSEKEIKALIKERSKRWDAYKDAKYGTPERDQAEEAWEEFRTGHSGETWDAMEAFESQKHEKKRTKALEPLSKLEPGSRPLYEGPKISEESKEYLEMYKTPESVGGSTFGSLNSFLANGPSKKDSKENIDFYNRASNSISEAIQNSRLSEDSTLYRVITQGSDFAAKHTKLISELLKLSPGDIFESKAFSSTTHDLDFFKSVASSTPNGVKLVINAPKGSPGYSFDQNESDEEHEVLLDKNSKFRIDEVDKKNRIFKLTLLNKEEEGEQEPPDLPEQDLPLSQDSKMPEYRKAAKKELEENIHSRGSWWVNRLEDAEKPGSGYTQEQIGYAKEGVEKYKKELKERLQGEEFEQHVLHYAYNRKKEEQIARNEEPTYSPEEDAISEEDFKRLPSRLDILKEYRRDVEDKLINNENRRNSKTHAKALDRAEEHIKQKYFPEFEKESVREKETRLSTARGSAVNGTPEYTKAEKEWNEFREKQKEMFDLSRQFVKEGELERTREDLDKRWDAIKDIEAKVDKDIAEHRSGKRTERIDAAKAAEQKKIDAKKKAALTREKKKIRAKYDNTLFEEAKKENSLSYQAYTQHLEETKDTPLGKIEGASSRKTDPFDFYSHEENEEIKRLHPRFYELKTLQVKADADRKKAYKKVNELAAEYKKEHGKPIPDKDWFRLLESFKTEDTKKAEKSFDEYNAEHSKFNSTTGRDWFDVQEKRQALKEAVANERKPEEYKLGIQIEDNEKFIENNKWNGTKTDEKVLKSINQTHSLSPSQVSNIFSYSSSSSHIQGYLIHGGTHGRIHERERMNEEKLKYRIENVSKAIDSFLFSEDIQAYRGMRVLKDSPESKAYLEQFLNSEVGTLVHNKAFASVTYSKQVFNNYQGGNPEEDVTMHITLEKGKHGLPMDVACREKRGNKEILLNKGSYFKINKINKKKRIVEVTVLSEDEAAREQLRTQENPEEKPAIDSIPLEMDSFPFKIYHGLTCVIENYKGEIRHGRGFSTRMPADYGYIQGYWGADGDEMDCYLGPNPMSRMVYVVWQSQIGSPTFDEHKCMLGYPSKAAASKAYMSGHNRSKDIFMKIESFGIEEFKRWLKKESLRAA